MKDKKRIREMLKMRRTHTLQEIGDYYGISRERVRQIIGTRNKPLPKYQWALKLKNRIFKLRETHTYEEIAEITGINKEIIRNTLARKMREAGIVRKLWPDGYWKCYGCKTIKKADEFSPSMRFPNKSGRRCRECAKESARKYYHAEYYRKGGKYYQRSLARSSLGQALSSGKIRKGKCAVGGNCEGRIEAHHWLGYDKEHYLDVIWLCSYHHDIVDDLPLDTIIHWAYNSIIRI